MTRLALLIAGLALLISTSAEADRPGSSWRVVCDNDATAQEPLCHIAIFAQDKANGSWLGIAVQILNGMHEIQVTSSGSAYHSAEIDAELDTTIYTDYCYGSYCVFVHAESLVERFKSETRMNVRLFNGATKPSVEKHISLLGFTKAYEEYLLRIGE
jgi:invasion protein IalB